MVEVWARIEKWLEANAREVAAGLNPPASDEEIAKTEQFLGEALPEDARASFRCHDGQSSDSPGMLDGWELLSLARIRDEWQVWKQLLDGGDFASSVSDGDGATVRSDWWNTAWIPLTYSGGG